MRLMSIGDAARASGLSAKALRLYDESGLLPPAEVDPVSGYRWYAADQLDRARLVARLRLAGMPLARIRVVVDLAGRSGRAAAAELTSWWRQAEADSRSTRALVADLVVELDAKEQHMSSTTTTAAEAASYLAQGGRDDQQDAVLVGDGVYAVADGFGGAPGLADEVVRSLADLGDGDPLAGLDAAVARAGALVAERYADRAGAGCTLTALRLGGGQVALAHLGDSRAYRVREGRLERLTRDHSIVQTLVDEGRLTPEEARSDERRVQISRAIASDASFEPDLALHAIQPGDRLVLTTDGVHAVLAPGALTDLLVAGGTPGEVAEAVRVAVRDAGEPDNHAVVVLDL